MGWMRALVVFSLASVLGLAAVAGEEGRGRNDREQFMDKLYSVYVPDEWFYTQDDDGQLKIEDKKDSGNFLLILPPNPAAADNPAEFAGMKLGALFGSQGEIDIIEETRTEIREVDATQVLFSVKENGKTALLGTVTVLKVQGAPVVMVAAESAKSDDDFLSKVEYPMASYEVNSRWLKAREKELAEAGRVALEEAKVAADGKAPVIEDKDEGDAEDRGEGAPITDDGTKGDTWSDAAPSELDAAPPKSDAAPSELDVAPPKSDAAPSELDSAPPKSDVWQG